MHYIRTKFHENIGSGFNVLKWKNFILKKYKGREYVSSVGGVKILVLCIMSD